MGTIEEYKAALENAGFQITGERNKRDFAQKFFEKMRLASKDNGGPPPLGLHIVMGQDAELKLSNMIRGIEDNHIAPTELFAEKPSTG